MFMYGFATEARHLGTAARQILETRRSTFNIIPEDVHLTLYTKPNTQHSEFWRGIYLDVGLGELVTHGHQEVQGADLTKKL
jgi:hypothetical protein